MADVISIWRHPIKSHGREAISQSELIAGQTMPGDRVWAVAHEASQADGREWVPCANFNRVSKVPALMAMTARYDDDAGIITLEHPEIGALTFDPATDQDTFLAWVKPIMPQDRAQSARLISVPGRGMTDSDFPSVTLCNHASHIAVEQNLGTDLSIHRWRGNIWLDGIPAWEEFDWMNREVQIGDAVLRVREPTDRCLATTANPTTGLRDADILGALKSFDHQDFSVRAEVLRGGTVHIGSKVQVL